MSTRPATHAGSWYSNRRSELSSQLVGYLNDTGMRDGGISKARLIISPHAGYRYCGATMAHAYASLDVNPAIKRVFILGPSHHVYFRNQIFVTRFHSLETPLGSLQVDVEVVKKLHKLQEGHLFVPMDNDADMGEHSLEMQFPMLVQTLQWRGIDVNSVKIVPMMVSHNSAEVDLAVGNVLKEYLMDPSNLFAISSDFCHWGRRFAYTGYVGSQDELEDALQEETEIEMLTARSKLSHHQVDVWQSIELLDKMAMKVLSDNTDDAKYNAWKQYLDITGNTICGARPIAVMLSALQTVRRPAGKTRFEWPSYSQSSHVKNLDESSVSYAAGYAVIDN
ncbi:hypothetical protein HG537_0E04890 [Torulaspora globosa]|uniref:Uncharacterized protein n=1 Tax=Torulaspora globosa TaxID=48254 RepID=A0A7H9HTR7_9SACH|nr:hypothetical protein HG537_0E04890 [Torulaspora sp. CBS 2947]